MTVTSAAGASFAQKLGCHLVVLAGKCLVKEINKTQRLLKGINPTTDRSASTPFSLCIEAIKYLNLVKTMTSTADSTSTLTPSTQAENEAQTENKVDKNLPLQIQHYFDSLNQKEFEQVANLFAENGQLIPPFDEPIVGRKAVAQYLRTEANEMTLVPMQCEPIDENTGDSTLKGKTFLVRGKVKTALFKVNVAWRFTLNDQAEIIIVKVKLLATLQELIKFK
ncbi:MAG: nuclear transport factor 2 family protein [Phormidesmis sp.]